VIDALPPVWLDAGVGERIASALRHEGYGVVDDALPVAVVDALGASLRRRSDDEFRRAGVGRDDDRRRATVRGDFINWLDGDDAPTRWFLDWAELLRLELNRLLFLGLFEHECHFAWYPAGSFYATHLDAFRGERNRRVSSVLYLNADWRPASGGELVLYRPIDGALTAETPLTVERIVAPRRATLVVFLSEEFPHEVLPALTPRYSIAGWYRTNASSSTRLDPPR
jgi:SM-20-related protein